MKTISFFLFLFGLGIGYFWGYSAMKQYEANPKNCMEIVLKENALLLIDAENIFYDTFLKNMKKGDTILYGYGSNLFKIKKIKEE